MPTPTDLSCHRGALVSVEGLNGVGKTYLTTRLATSWSGPAPLVLEEFSARTYGPADLGRAILGTLFTAAHADPFLRGGHPGAETVSLFAVKMFDFERSITALKDGRTVIEGRSIHSTAVYQSLIAYPNNDDVAYDHAIELLTLAASWRPLPDLTINITDDVETAIGRAERRDNRTYTAEQRQIHRRAADMFARLAQADPDRVTVLDRRLHDADTLVNIMRAQISGLGQLPCLPEPWRATPACPPACGQPVAKLA